MSEIITHYTRENYIDAYDYDKILEILRIPDDGAHIRISNTFSLMSDRGMDIYFENGKFTGIYFKKKSMRSYDEKNIRITEYYISYNEDDEHIMLKYIPMEGDPSKMKGRPFTIRPDYKPYGGRDGYRYGGY